MRNGSISQFAVVTGASSGAGLELARAFARHGYDLLICADNASINNAADELRHEGHRVDALRVDLVTYDGVERLCDAIRRDERALDAIAINARVGSAGSFIEIDLAKELDVIQRNVVSVVHLAKRTLPAMLARNEGRILFTSPTAADAPHACGAVYEASTAFLQTFARALRSQLKHTSVKVAVVQPDAIDKLFPEAPAAKATLSSAAAKAKPERTAAEEHRTQAKPGSAIL